MAWLTVDSEFPIGVDWVQMVVCLCGLATCNPAIPQLGQAPAPVTSNSIKKVNQWMEVTLK